MENINDKMLTNAALLFVLVILAVILLQWGLAPSYALTNQQVQETVTSQDKLILPYQLNEMISNKQIDAYTVVDLREQTEPIDAFKKVINIPFASLLSRSSLKQLNKEESLLLMGDSESQAMMALNLLSAKGFENVFVLANDADFIQNKVLTDFKPAEAEARSEKARFAYPRFFKSEAVGGTKSTAAPKVPGGTVVVKAAGGC